MRTEEIAYIDNMIEHLYKGLLELKSYIGEKKGENRAYELNRNKIILFQKLGDIENKGDDTPMIYKGIKLRKRKDQRWEARWQKNNNNYSVYGNTQLECYNKLKAEYESKKNKSKNEKTLYEWLDYWLMTYKSECKSKENEIAIRVHIKKHIKNIELSKITQSMIQELLNKLNNKKRTSITVFNVMNEAFDIAVQNRIIKENPCKFIKRPKHTRVIGTALTIEEEKELLTKIKGNSNENLILFILYSGVRRGEALSICWEDFDYSKNRIHIKGTKTEKSDRYIPLFPKIKAIIDNMESKSNGLVFNIKSNTITQYFARLNIGEHKLHDLRHTFATRCLELNIPMKYVQKWLGHSSYKTTADIYSHVNNDNLENEYSKRL